MKKIYSISFFVGFAVLLLLSCGGTKKTTTATPVATEEMPNWLKERPIGGSYYIGIGAADKMRNPLDYAEVAKKNALNDLASEISVVVQGNSFLNVMESNQNFTEEFQSTINTTTQENIEGFELMDSYEANGQYWVFYRLNKSAHAQRKAERKRLTMNSAYDYMLKAELAEKQGNITAATDLYIRGLLDLKPYWNEKNEFQSDAGFIFIENEIFGKLQSMFSDLELLCSTEDIYLSKQNDYQTKVSVLVRLRGAEAKGVPFKYLYGKKTYMKARESATDSQGIMSVSVEDADIQKIDNTLDVWLDTKALASSMPDEKLARVLLEGLKEVKSAFAIRAKKPTALLQSNERNFGNATDFAKLSDALKTEMTKRGFSFTTNTSEADYVVLVESNTTPGGQSQGFYVAFLDMTLRVLDAESQNELYAKTMSGIKGVQLNVNAAGSEAYKNGQKKIKNELAKDLVSAVL